MSTKTQLTEDFVTLLPELNTGDIVLFSGKGGASAGIKWATFSRWSHVGVILKLDTYDFALLWESTISSALKDFDTGNVAKGVQLTPLSERVESYDGEVAVRRLCDATFTSDQIDALLAFHEEVQGRKYETSEAELIKAAYDGPGGANEEDLSSLFCSELVAETYQRIGLLPDGKGHKPSNEYIPADFAGDRRLDLLRGYLSPEIMLRA